MNENASKIVDALGGVTVVAKIFEIKPPSVFGWKLRGIPHARAMYLKAVHKDDLVGLDIDAATIPPGSCRRSKSKQNRPL